MKCIVLGGFLGSGKTTVLLKLAKSIINQSQGKSENPLVIIENEIGEISVDSKLLGDFEVRELFSGCICCTLTSDLTRSIKGLYDEFHPEWIIVEATGLAYPDKIVETIRQYAHECEKVMTLTIADAGRWFEVMDYMDVLLLGQMKTGDLMLLNKIDLVDTMAVKEIESELKKINPEADVVVMSAKNGIGDLNKRIGEYFASV